jgi:hypothetical protein
MENIANGTRKCTHGNPVYNTIICQGIILIQHEISSQSGMANGRRNGGLVNGVLKSSRDGIKVRNNLVNEGNLVCRNFIGCKEEDLTVIISRVYANGQ